jgi:hypothetical protein
MAEVVDDLQERVERLVVLAARAAFTQAVNGSEGARHSRRCNRQNGCMSAMASLTFGSVLPSWSTYTTGVPGGFSKKLKRSIAS